MNSIGRRFHKLFYCGLVLLFFCKSAVAAPIQVVDYGDTGWQTFSYTFDNQLVKFRIGVSNEKDIYASSRVLLDNLEIGGDVFYGFESDIASLNIFGTSYQLEQAFGFNITYYYPTEGSYLLYLMPNILPEQTPIDTSAYGGTTGAYIDFMLDFSKIDGPYTFSFDWNFLAYDYDPQNDFVFIDAMIPNQDDSFDSLFIQKLAEIAGPNNVVPEPGTALLLGAGLLGLAIAGRRRI